MGLCALNGVFWVSAAGWVGGMAMAPPAARAETAHARFMAKRRAKTAIAADEAARAEQAAVLAAKAKGGKKK